MTRRDRLETVAGFAAGLAIAAGVWVLVAAVIWESPTLAGAGVLLLAAGSAGLAALVPR